ncbi:rRNA maturation RNase YbeY [Thermodesulfobacteriota bacterium]
MTKVLKDLDCHESELSILLTDDEYMAELNRRYLGKDGATNVLAFPMSGETAGDASVMLGDIVISVDTAVHESERAGEPLEETILRLLIHGLLHLLDFDHERSHEAAQLMEKEQLRLLNLLKEG